MKIAIKATPTLTIREGRLPTPTELVNESFRMYKVRAIKLDLLNDRGSGEAWKARLN